MLALALAELPEFRDPVPGWRSPPHPDACRAEVKAPRAQHSPLLERSTDLSALEGPARISLPLTRGTQGRDRSRLESPRFLGWSVQIRMRAFGSQRPTREVVCFTSFLPGPELRLHYSCSPCRDPEACITPTFSAKACLGSLPAMVNRSIQCRLRSNAFKVGQGFPFLKSQMFCSPLTLCFRDSF